ncbi:hypothetical protein [Beijerinckia indica]|uniref:Uncharacterized protein n=1 Tax=Beijerinckia indica subsp. indica (strain ATCC 9039 / DSM 1715 / NCIMB 8712) TaxID=395963 RepID=B2ILN6_BEII9|nr:hypothetical protein [Beijerinckia indica]ACB97436.1 hypothetical protein Bind_3911 [Beijerinckia indica subsp. indica ATCC 9039]
MSLKEPHQTTYWFLLMSICIMAVSLAGSMSAHSQPSPIGQVQELTEEAYQVPGTLIIREGRSAIPGDQNYFWPDSAAIDPKPSHQRKHPYHKH